MAYANLKTNKIYGCKKGTLTYYHELAHLKFEETKSGRSIRTMQEISFDALVMCVGLYIIYPLIILRYLTLILILSKIFYNMIEEIYCWQVAKKKLNEVRRDRRKVTIKV